MNNNFSVDDIHAIRERNTRKYLTMSAEELKGIEELEQTYLREDFIKLIKS